LVLAGFVLLIWLPALRCPPATTVVAGVVAEASLYIYLTHFQIYPLFEGRPLLGVIASILVGIGLTRFVSRLRLLLREREATARFRPVFRSGFTSGALPFGDKPFLHHGRRDQTVGADQASGHDGASTRGGR
jgi:hypothetical protein